jgi:hypothetical protein
MQEVSFFQVLSYGAIGLGCILAVLAYRLLSQAQNSKTGPAESMLRAIYAYMGFCLALTGLGFAAELTKVWFNDRAAQHKIADLNTQLEKARGSETTIADIQKKLSTSREVLNVLMEQKVGKVAKLATLNPHSAGYAEIMTQIRDDLGSIDKAIQDAIKE